MIIRNSGPGDTQTRGRIAGSCPSWPDLAE
jgi:hypothetical protein